MQGRSPTQFSQALASAPAGSGCIVTRKDLTATGSGSIALAAGGYLLFLEGTIPAYLNVGAAAVVPADTADEAGFYLAPGVYVPLSLPDGGVLHGILASTGTSSLLATQVTE
jgi:hypothetical protein